MWYLTVLKTLDKAVYNEFLGMLELLDLICINKEIQIKQQLKANTTATKTL